MVTILFLAGSPLLWVSEALPGPCQAETSYFCIRTERVTTADGRPATGLFLDRLMHSAIREDDPNALGYGYERVYQAFTEQSLARDPALRLLVIGAGGYAFPRFMAAAHPAARVEVLEIDPGVVRFNRQHLGLPADSPIVTHVGDARLFFGHGSGETHGRYAVIQGDAFNDVSVPYHLTTREFDLLVRDSLTPDGIYLVNMIDSGREGRFVQAYVNTLYTVFSDVAVYALDGQLGRPGHTTFVIAAASRPLSAPAVPDWTIVPSATLGEHFTRRTTLVLTDDHTPVDTLLRAALDDR